MTDPTSAQITELAIKAVADTAAYSIVFATIVKLLPPLAALISILWIGFQFYHSEPMKEWRQKRKDKHGTD